VRPQDCAVRATNSKNAILIASGHRRGRDRDDAPRSRSTFRLNVYAGTSTEFRLRRVRNGHPSANSPTPKPFGHSFAWRSGQMSSNNDGNRDARRRLARSTATSEMVDPYRRHPFLDGRCVAHMSKGTIPSRRPRPVVRRVRRGIQLSSFKPLDNRSLSRFSRVGLRPIRHGPR